MTKKVRYNETDMKKTKQDKQIKISRVTHKNLYKNLYLKKSYVF